MLQIITYSGTANPAEHLESFKALMELHGVSAPVICRAFSSTLSGVARQWFRQLKPRFIGSFLRLSKAVLTHFISGRDRRKPLAHLLTIKQREDELLRDHLIYFNAEVVQVDDYSDQIALTAIVAGLKQGKFLFSIGKNSPNTLVDLLNRAKKYSNVEELFSSRKTVRRRNNSTEDRKRREKGEHSTVNAKRKKEDDQDQNQHTNRHLKSRFHRYITLNAKPEQGRKEVELSKET
ncbi:uncharacterized protein LOC131246924 [Magnolia sinica]|uniref:uncharacterized protein LOC131246924 n=1 Tax=Magnolia sinica TaxID=86752 RepID=UPI0026585612|nr:uncharacterized protein LOC131246924 [Magnolia sinica]